MDQRGCVFCRIASKEIPASIVFENKYVIAFDDLKPQAPVHVLIIPKKHIDTVSDFKDGEAGDVGMLVLAARTIARAKNVDRSGYRIVLNCNKDAGQDVFHVHLHLLGGRPMAWPPG